MKSVRSVATFVLVSSALVASVQACDGDTIMVAPATVDSAFRAGEKWTGYVENFKFQSGSDQITITFTTPTEGTLYFGAAPNGPQEVNPDVGIPANIDWLTDSGDVDTPVQALATQLESVTFKLHDALREDGRVRFKVNLAEVWSPWCAAQSVTYPVQLSQDTVVSNCLPTVPRRTQPFRQEGSGQCSYQDIRDPSGRTNALASCSKVWLCSMGACACDANHCELDLQEPTVNSSFVVSVDLRIVGNDADGTTTLGRGIVHRQ